MREHAGETLAISEPEESHDCATKKMSSKSSITTHVKNDRAAKLGSTPPVCDFAFFAIQAYSHQMDRNRQEEISKIGIRVMRAKCEAQQMICRRDLGALKSVAAAYCLCQTLQLPVTRHKSKKNDK